MSVFGNIVTAIFGSHAASATSTGGASAAPSQAGSPGATAPKPISMTEVEATIAKIADGQSAKYNWNESIVDLMKLLKLDSGLDARKQLAQELGYTGALTGSADMNIWLHKEVMAKLAESGGVVPDSLKHA
jgi:Rieske Fe-S protein